MVMCRNLEVPEVRKFEAMLAWAKHKIKTKTSSKIDARLEFKCIMERLARDLKLYRITPQELIKVYYFVKIFAFFFFFGLDQNQVRIRVCVNCYRSFCPAKQSKTNEFWKLLCFKQTQECIEYKTVI